MTAPVWIRGILQDHYGVPIDAQPYLFGGEEEPGRIEKMSLKLPPHIKVSPIALEIFSLNNKCLIISLPLAKDNFFIVLYPELSSAI